MRIVMDTGDLRNLASIARNCSNTLGAINGDVRRTRHTVHLNTRDDAALRRHRPHDVAVGIERELSGLQREYADRARSYEQRAQRIEDTERMQWRPFPLPIIIGLPGSWWRIPTQPVLPYFPGLLPQTGGQVPLWTLPFRSVPNLTVIGLVARRAPSLLEQGVGLIGRGIDALRRGFTTVTDRLVETVADAWNRIWSRTAQTLQSVVAGLRNIVVSGVRVAVNGVRTATTTVGRWITNAWNGAWSLVGNYFARVVKIAKKVVTLLKGLKVWAWAVRMGWVELKAFLLEKVVFAKFSLKKLPWLGIFLGAALAIKDFMDFGIGDARVWQSIFEVVGGIAAAGAMIAVGAPAALGLIALSVGVLIGTLIANYVTVPLYNNWYDSRNPSAANNAAEQRRVSGTAGGGGPSGAVPASSRGAVGLGGQATRNWVKNGSYRTMGIETVRTLAVVAPTAMFHFREVGGLGNSVEFGLVQGRDMPAHGVLSAAGIGFSIAQFGLDYRDYGAWDARTMKSGVDLVAGVAVKKVPFGGLVWKGSTGATEWAVNEIDRKYDTSGAFISSVVARTGEVPDYSGPTGLFRYLGDAGKNAVSLKAWGFR